MDTPADRNRQNNSNDQAASDATGAAAAGAHSGAGGNDLPVVPSPKLGAEAAGEKPGASSIHGALPALLHARADDAPGESEQAASASQRRPFRFALLAVTIACAGGIGALAGALTTSGIGDQRVADAAVSQAADAPDIMQALQAQRAEISALKASLETANRNAGAQLAKISDRLNGLEHAAADPAAKLAHIADVVDRLEKQASATADITGSIGAPAPAPATRPKLRVLRDWAVQDVRDGRAMVESRDGAFFLVGTGSIMPSLGRVEQVKRQNGQWIVVTEKGLITQHP